jgi:hypothetical protein
MKFRKIDKVLLARMQAGDDQNGEGEENVLADEEEDEMVEGEASTMQPASIDTIAFEINPNIDIDSPALIDMISEEAVVSEAPLNALSRPVDAANRTFTVEEAFEDW